MNPFDERIREREIDRFFREEHRIIVPLTVREILDEEIACKLA